MTEWLDGFVAGVLEGHRHAPLRALFRHAFHVHPDGEFPRPHSRHGAADRRYRPHFRDRHHLFHFLPVPRLQASRACVPRSFLGPLWWLAWFFVVIEVADNLFRPFSLGIRLYANMFADHKVLGIVHGTDLAGHSAGVLRARLDRLRRPGARLRDPGGFVRPDGEPFALLRKRGPARRCKFRRQKV